MNEKENNGRICEKNIATKRILKAEKHVQSTKRMERLYCRGTRRRSISNINNWVEVSKRGMVPH